MKKATNRKEKTIVIVGPGASGQELGRYAEQMQFWDGRIEFWGINAAYRVVNVPWSKMFNLHRLAHLERDCPQYVDWDTVFSRRNPKVEMVVVDSWKRLLTNQVLFPRGAMAGQPRADYHASSFDWLVAYAIHLKADVISLHGCRFAIDGPGQEPISAQACLEYWCGYATGKGIDVIHGADCELFQQYHLVASHSVYGFDDVRMVERRK